jgi:DNA helicase IV
MSDFSSEFFIDRSKLDDFQRQLLNRALNKSMVVTGSAGSGKSLIALHKAKQIASTEGESQYAIVVFTKTLHKYFNDGLRQLGLSNVYLYNDFIRSGGHVKYLIVDECQDFSQEEINSLKSRADHLLFFGDDAQLIMGFRIDHPVKLHSLASTLNVNMDQLYFNYRLTKQIAKLAERVGSVSDVEMRCIRDGELPNLISGVSYNDELKQIAQLIKNNKLTNVGILLPFNTCGTGGEWSVEYVKDFLTKQQNIPCEFKYNANQSTEMDLDFHSELPKVMTWWCAKGLQFKDVFIPGCHKMTERQSRSALYVAMTRSCERLYLSHSSRLDSSYFPNPSDSVYKQKIEIEDI